MPIDHMSLGEARRDSTASQQTIGSALSTDTTYVGIVNGVVADIDDVADLIDDRLAPPDQLFYRWHSVFDELVANANGNDSITAHNEAVDAVDYRTRFDRYLTAYDPAQQAIREYGERSVADEHVVFVCYCSEGKWCHRTMVANAVREHVESIEPDSAIQ
jgi:hypothetical protein